MTSTGLTEWQLAGVRPGAEEMVRDVLTGLSEKPRSLPTRYLYDARGSELFERITELPEYYLTRTEMSIFDAHLSDMAEAIGPDAWLIELGSGAGVKTRRLLEAMRRPAGFTPVEISAAALRDSVRELSGAMPSLTIESIRGDFTRDLTLPAADGRRRTVFFPGSTIGNLSGEAARALLMRIANWVGPGGGLLIGIDLVKPPGILVPAYDDSAGVTAAFNLNLLARLNREADADFDLDSWTHRAVWNDAGQRMESYLVSDRAQRAHVAGRPFDFEAGEAVWTEQSQKYTIGSLMGLAERFELAHAWQDDKRWCAVLYLRVPAEGGPA